MSAQHRDTLPDPEQGTFDVVLPVQPPPSHISLPSSSFPNSSTTSELGKYVSKGVLTNVSSQATLSPMQSIPVVVNGEPRITPVDMEGAPVPITPQSPGEKVLVVSDEKAVVTLSEKPKEAAAAPPSQVKPAGKPAPKWKRASRWIRFQIWFNTYRSATS